MTPEERLTALRDDIVQAMHAHDCRGAGVAPWPLSETPHRAREYDARVDAVMAVVGPAFAKLAIDVEHQVRTEWHEFGGGRVPLHDPTAADANAWPPVQRVHFLGGHHDGLPCLRSDDPGHVQGTECEFAGTGVPQADDTEAVQS